MQSVVNNKDTVAISKTSSTASNSSERVKTSKHIRPKLIRRDKLAKRQETVSALVSNPKDYVDELLEQTRVQMENTTVSCCRDDIALPPFPPKEENSIVPSVSTDNHEQSETETTAVQSIKPKGILKQTRRYAPRPSTQSTSTKQRAPSELNGSGTMNIDRELLPQEKQTVMSFFKDNIVERPIPIPASISNEDKTESTDGYRDDIASNVQTSGGKVVRSLSELVSLASNLHSMGSGSSDIETIETHMEFSCMPKEDYDDLVKQAKSSGIPVAKYLETLQEDNKESLDSKDGVDSGDNDDDDHNQDEEDDGDDIFDFFGGALTEEEERSPPPLRAFMVLWNAISMWITADAVALLKSYKNDIFISEEPPLTVESNIALTKRTEMSDICASRCASLMSMLKINLVRSLDELGYSTSDNYTRRMAETRLGEFVQKFDFTEPMVKFNSIQWRALTIILLNIVLPRHDLAYEGKTGIIVRDEVSQLTLPNTLKEVGMSVEEYRYLVDTAIPSLDVGSG